MVARSIAKQHGEKSVAGWRGYLRSVFARERTWKSEEIEIDQPLTPENIEKLRYDGVLHPIFYEHPGFLVRALAAIYKLMISYP